MSILSELVAYELAQKSIQHEILHSLLYHISRVAQIHATRKQHIPSSSLWFAKTSEFTRWNLVSSSMTSIAIQTGVSPLPELIPEHAFVERQCDDVIVKCLDYLLKEAAYDDAIVVLMKINSMASTYAQGFDHRQSLELAGKSAAIVKKYLNSDVPSIDPLRQLELADVSCVTSLAPVLATSVALTEVKVEQSMAIVDSVLALDWRAAYASAMPRPVSNRVEELLSCIDFERQTEGKRLTQPWYLKQLVAYAYADFVRDLVKGIADTVEQQFVSAAISLSSKKSLHALTLWLLRSIEACNKANAQIFELRTRYDELKAFQICDNRWYDLKDDVALGRIEKARATVFRMLADVVPDICKLPPDPRLPDLVGQTRARIADELLTMMESKREDGFKDLFRSFFNATLNVEGHFFELAKEAGKEDLVRVGIDARLDLMELSGIAFIFSELDETQFRTDVAAVWDFYFEQTADKRKVLNSLLATTSRTIGLPIFSSSAMQRQEWKSRTAHALINRGGKSDFGLDPFAHRARNTHRSAVIESIHLMYGHPMDSLYVYFGALYLAKRPEAVGQELPQEIERCVDAIERVLQARAGADDASTMD